MMVTLEQKIGAKLVYLMPKNIEIFTVQAQIHPEYGSNVAVLGGGIVDSETELALKEVLSLLCGLQNQRNNYGFWTRCNIGITAQKEVQLRFLDDTASAQEHDLFDTQVKTCSFVYHPSMLFALALDYAMGLNGIGRDVEQARVYFKELTRYETLSLAAYYNWIALECGSKAYMEVEELEILELLSRVRKADAAALYVLGLMYHSGFRTLQPNIKLAMLYYRRSAALGCIQARLRAEDLYGLVTRH